MTSNKLEQYAFHAEPQVTQRGDSWTARYPHQDWSVSASSQQQALQQLKDEFMRRQNAGEAGYGFADGVCRQHLTDPVPGMYAMDNALYLQLRDAGATQEDFQRAFEEAEAKRQSGERYTMEDYLQL